jgi:hypothetical protein
MATSVKPPKRKTHPPVPTREESLGARLDRLAAEVGALRNELVKLRGEVHVMRGTRRNAPPPLPRPSEDDVITVDERDVTLESVKPPRGRR